MAEGPTPPDALDAAQVRVATASAVPEPAYPVLFLFLDGVGVGEDDAGRNPLAAAAMPELHALLGGPLTRSTLARETPTLLYRPLDAGLEHAGLPQSATGQTTLLTGQNGAALMRGHYGPWPGPTLIRALEHDTLFHAATGTAALANVYPPEYFRGQARRRVRPNAPVVAARAAGVGLRRLADYRVGKGVPADLTGAYFASSEADLPAIGERMAGQWLATLSRRHTFTFFDVWLTDRLGHKQDALQAVKLLERFDRFLAALLSELDNVTLVLTSDHGNLEDMATRSHTRNPVPLLVLGPGAFAFREAGSLLDVAPAIRALWQPAGEATRGA